MARLELPNQETNASRADKLPVTKKNTSPVADLTLSWVVCRGPSHRPIPRCERGPVPQLHAHPDGSIPSFYIMHASCVPCVTTAGKTPELSSTCRRASMGISPASFRTASMAHRGRPSSITPDRATPERSGVGGGARDASCREPTMPRSLSAWGSWKETPRLKHRVLRKRKPGGGRGCDHAAGATGGTSQKDRETRQQGASGAQKLELSRTGARLLRRPWTKTSHGRAMYLRAERKHCGSFV